jgi:hypothetical protein
VPGSPEKPVVQNRTAFLHLFRCHIAEFRHSKQAGRFVAVIAPACVATIDQLVLYHRVDYQQRDVVAAHWHKEPFAGVAID